MTTSELAARLNGRECGFEITQEEAREAAEHGLVVAYGYSDDLVEFEGAIRYEIDCWEGGTIRITKDGAVRIKARCDAGDIHAIWNDEGNPCWRLETDIPHEEFNIYEEGELFGVGIVFRVEDLA